jgi:hypothetical protein
VKLTYHQRAVIREWVGDIAIVIAPALLFVLVMFVFKF